MTTIKFSYKTSDFQTSGILCNNNIFYSKLATFPLYNNSIDLQIIGRGLLSNYVASTDISTTINEIGTYYLDPNESISVDNNIGYIYSFKNDNVFFISPSIINTSIVFSSGIYNGKKGNIAIDVLDNINRNVTITINN